MKLESTHTKSPQTFSCTASSCVGRSPLRERNRPVVPCPRTIEEIGREEKKDELLLRENGPLGERKESHLTVVLHLLSQFDLSLLPSIKAVHFLCPLFSVISFFQLCFCGVRVSFLSSASTHNASCGETERETNKRKGCCVLIACKCNNRRKKEEEALPMQARKRKNTKSVHSEDR